MEHYKERGRKTAFSATGSHNEWGKIKRSNTRVQCLNNFFITITEILNIQQIKKGDAVSILQDPFPGNFSSIKIILMTEADIKSIIHSLTPSPTKKIISLWWNNK
jgi:hypothetical protein